LFIVLTNSESQLVAEKAMLWTCLAIKFSYIWIFRAKIKLGGLMEAWMFVPFLILPAKMILLSADFARLPAQNLFYLHKSVVYRPNKYSKPISR
jgi:hypothetical protein